jgi:uncharacterized protein
MKLALRNAIAEWFLDALEEPTGTAALDALVAFARATGDDGAARGLSAAHRDRLVASGFFESDGESVRLRPDLLGDLATLRERALRFGAARSDVAARGLAVREDASLDAVVAAAAILFDHELFFEVHELLEPPWLRADGETRMLLQGLIQVAVGFHHHGHGNPRGAASLLGEGNAKLFGHVPEAFGLDLSALCRDVEAFATELRHRLAGQAPARDLVIPRLVRTESGIGKV